MIPKFKVWDTYLDTWHNDADGYISNSEWIGINELIGWVSTVTRNDHDVSAPPRYIISQFTGALDENGTEIYVGDLLHNENGVFEVKWSNTYHGFIAFGGLHGRVIGTIYKTQLYKEGGHAKTQRTASEN